MKHRLFFTTILAACLLPVFVMGQPAPANSDLDAPVYEGAKFQRYADADKGVIVASFCSNAPPISILKYYRSAFNKALEIQVGSLGGPVNRILLDVSSPSDWRNAKKFIEIYEDKKTAECSSIIRITTGIRQTDTESSGVKVDLGLQESQAITPASSREKTIGIGGYVNTLNFSAGPSVILWPAERLAVQGNYGVGTFTSYEVRGLYRFDTSSSFKPYIGAGYINAEKESKVIGVDTKITGDSMSMFAGVEKHLYKSIYTYVDISGTTMKFEKNVKSSTQSATVTVDYTPVTVNAGIIFYIW